MRWLHPANPEYLFWTGKDNGAAAAQAWGLVYRHLAALKPFASPWTSDNGTTERFVDYVLKKGDQGKVDNESTQIG